MILYITFAVSGAVIVLLLLTKVLEIKHKKKFILSRVISKGDHRIRVLSHNATHQYSVLKEDTGFFIKQQLPLHTKNILKKVEAHAKEKSEKYIGNIRNTRLIKPRNEGISEFFKNMSEKEKDDTIDEVSEGK